MVYMILFVFGAAAGSFLMASVWRLRANQLADSHAKDEASEYTKLVKKRKLHMTSSVSDRSCCLNCGYRLRWYDLLPVVSWLSLRGRCRRCHHFIGWSELVSEIAVGVLFAGSGYFWLEGGFFDQPFGWFGFGLWLVCLMLLAVLFVYDLKWMLLPSSVLYAAIGCALVFAIWREVLSGLAVGFSNQLGAAAVLFGIYYILGSLSPRGKSLVGDGDAWLGLALALLLGDFRLALLTLFLANLIGTLLALPMLVTRKIGRGKQLPLGPLLVVGFLISYFFGWDILRTVLF